MGKERQVVSPQRAGRRMDYMLERWASFTRFLEDGRICLTNNAAERALRRLALQGPTLRRLRSRWRAGCATERRDRRRAAIASWM
jgi:transposase